MVEGSKFFGSHTTFNVIFTLKHTPKTCGLIFQHVWSLSSKLQTCFLASSQICSGGYCATCITLTKFPSCPCQLPFGLPTGFVKPWCKGLSPFIGVFWSRDFYFFHDPCTYCFLQYKCFHCCCTFIVSHGGIFHQQFKFVSELFFTCVFCPRLC